MQDIGKFLRKKIQSFESKRRNRTIPIAKKEKKKKKRTHDSSEVTRLSKSTGM